MLFVFTLLVTLISDNKSHTFICSIGPCGAMVARLTPDQKVTCSNHVEDQMLFVFTLHCYLIISNNKSHTFACSIGPCGAMVARLTPDQKVTCSNHVEVKYFSSLLYMLLSKFLIINRTHLSAQLGLVAQW